MSGEITVEAGTTLGNYVIEGPLGQGREGHVYVAHDSLLGRRVALKLPASGAAGEMRGLEEARICAKLDHPHVLRTYHAFRHKGVWIVAYEYAELGSVESRVEQAGPYSSRDALDLALQAARALDYLHQQGFLHRDLKPQNLLLGHQGYLKLADFGFALDLRSPESREAKAVGTPVFLAPELWQDAPATTSSDVYSLGMCLYYMLMGSVAFPFADMTYLKHAHIHLPPPLPTRLPRGVSELLLATLAKQPPARPSSGELVERIAALQRDPHATPSLTRGEVPPKIAEPFAQEGLERAARSAIEEGPERPLLIQLVQLLEASGRMILLVCDRMEEAELLLRVAVARSEGRYVTLARINPELDGTRLTGSLARASDTPTFSSLVAAREHLDGARARRSDGVSLVEMRLTADVSRERVEELFALRDLGLGCGFSLVCLAPPALAADARLHALDPALVALPGSTIHHGDFAARLARWVSTATAERFRLSPDGARAMWQAYRTERLPWLRLARETVLIAAAAQLPIATSWAVLAACHMPKHLYELADVPLELRRRPTLWPTPEVAERLATWRELARESEAPCLKEPMPVPARIAVAQEGPKL